MNLFLQFQMLRRTLELDLYQLLTFIKYYVNFYIYNLYLIAVIGLKLKIYLSELNMLSFRVDFFSASCLPYPFNPVKPFVTWQFLYLNVFFCD